MDLKLAEARAAFEAGRTAEAEALYRDIVRARPNDLDALRMFGVLCGMAGRHEEALSQFDRALRLNRRQPMTLYNRASSLLALARNAEGLDSLDRALKLGGPHPDIYSSRAVALRRLQRRDEAVQSCDLAIGLNPFHANAHLNKANALADLRRSQEALAAYDEALRLKAMPEAWAGRGLVLQRLGRIEEALAAFVKAYEIEPSQPYIEGAILHLKTRLAIWDGFAADSERLFRSVEQGKRVVFPGHMLSLPSNAAQQRIAAEIYVRDEYAFAAPRAPATRPTKKSKITIGYFSADFREHAVSFLAAGLFEHHDRREFEVVGFAYGGHPADDYTRRIAAGVDRFIDVSANSDDEAAALSRSLAVDIAVDLTGLTLDARLGIFARRAAPVQATYLGYPGTTGSAFMDFVIADEIVAPVADAKYFSETPIRIPVSYQINDSRRPPVGPPRERSEYGLPERGFVFCCFNNGFKLTPDVFAIWMRLLRRVEGSVLWLLASHETFAANLRKHARAQGVDPDRLVFAKRVRPDEHLARQRSADLALDTFYYNGHTTTSDALWAGLPVVTRIGETFAGRVAASLLEAVGLPELVTRSSQEYEELAFRLATDPDLLATLTRRVEHNRTHRSLFDTGETTRRLEAAYRAMLGRPPGA